MASQLAEETSAWLTVAVPVLHPIVSTLGCSFGAPAHFVVHPEECEQLVERQLHAVLSQLPRARTNGIVVRAPIARELMRRVVAADHDLVVMPAGARYAPLRVSMALRSPVPLLTPRLHRALRVAARRA